MSAEAPLFLDLPSKSRSLLHPELAFRFFVRNTRERLAVPCFHPGTSEATEVRSVTA
jgi:hypothetical protein